MPGVVISPASTTIPVVIRVSQATREFGSIVNAASSTASEIWSAILSGWPSVTDSEVNRYSMLSSWVTQITLLVRRSVPTVSLGVCVHRTGLIRLVRQRAADRDRPFNHRCQLRPRYIGGKIAQSAVRVD